MKIDTLTAKYVELRDRKAEIEKQAEIEKKKLTVIMDAIEEKIKEKMHEQGSTSIKTPHGTAYIAYKESATVADWEAVLGYITSNERWDMLERRVSKTAVKSIMDEDKDGNYTNPPPPGVNFTRFETVNIRRSK
jgi:hypothetical protein